MQLFSRRVLGVVLLIVLLAAVPLTVFIAQKRQEIRQRASAPQGPVRGIAGDLWADIVIGKIDFNQATPGEVVPFKVMNPGGVVVDKYATPNRVYVYDGANSRILGYRSVGQCSNNPATKCTTNSECGTGNTCNVSERKEADIVLGQPDKTGYSGCNNDGNMENYPLRKPASASTLCTTVNTQNSTREGGSSSSMYVDEHHNLYVTDFHNSRVLKYNDPFGTDTVADDVWGQDDFSGFRCNKTDSDIADGYPIPAPSASSLCMGRNTKYQDSFTAGVTLDNTGNLWVADSSNHRVLRFPKQSTSIAKTADLVLGQPNFTTRAAGSGLNQMSQPSSVRVGPEGNVYVADLGNNRVLVFTPPFANGMSASGTIGSNLRNPQSIELDPNGEGLWVLDTGNNMAELWSWDGSTVKKVISKDTYQPNGQCGSTNPITQCINPRPDGSCKYNLCGAYGSFGFDSDGNIYITGSRGFQDMVRYPAPFPSPQPGRFLSSDKNFFFPPPGSNFTSERALLDPRGIEVRNNQLIVNDGRRTLFYNNASGLTSGKVADGVLSPPGYTNFTFNSEDDWAEVRIRADNQNRLWVIRKATIDVYQLPLTNGASPMKTAITYANSLEVLGRTERLSWKHYDDFAGIDFDPQGNLWLSQASDSIHRVFRVRDPFTNPVVDVLLGHDNPTETDCNRNPEKRGYDKTFGDTDARANTLCKPGSVRVDRQGNVWVSDHSLEFHGNHRLLKFDADKFTNLTTALLGPNADLIATNMQVWEMSFDSANHMVIGYNGQTRESFPGLFLNPNNLNNTSNPTPDMKLKDFFSHGFSSTFDEEDNLYIADLNRGRVLIYKNPLNNAVTPRPTPTPTPRPGDSETVTYALGDGYTVIGVPVQTTATPAQLLANTNGKCTEVRGFDVTTGQAQQYSTDPARAQFNNLSQITGGKGYFIKCSGTGATVSLSGPAVTAMPSVVVGNVQYVSLPRRRTMTAEEFLQQVSTASIDCVSIDQWIGLWESHTKGRSANNFQMVDTEGYNVTCVASSGQPTQTPIPSPIGPTPTCTPIPKNQGNANSDCVINILDFAIWREEFVQEAGGTTSQKRANFDNSQTVDLVDFSIWRNNFRP